AEDGIRDFHVTGVQTCALPISAAEPLYADHLGAEIAQEGGAERPRDVATEIEDANAVQHACHVMPPLSPGSVSCQRGAAAKIARSEERRVGKDCRNGRTPEHEK